MQATERTPLVRGENGSNGHAEFDGDGLPETLSTKGRGRMESWEFPGFGSYDSVIDVDAAQLLSAEKRLSSTEEVPKLGELEATAICGNDILSSCLYVSSQVNESAGAYSPLCLAAVAAILWFYEGIYAEAITALTMNGGSYNVLINATSKTVAASAACLAVISYIATGVVSATTAVSYLQTLIPELPLVPGVILLHAFFASLNVSYPARAAPSTQGHIAPIRLPCDRGPDTLEHPSSGPRPRRAAVASSRSVRQSTSGFHRRRARSWP